ncbi:MULTISPECIES: hypothetical protein [unclassified Sulfitobacter]|uniref:hypothetical protein n=2 Tax=unclassified Sulfitobacter TaxID=196795 RepID=UPI0023E2D684|nr:MULTISPECIES: hypothetical protein [unclassified Sulfitobacter]
MMAQGDVFSPTVMYINPHALALHTLEPHLKWVVWSAENLPRFANRYFVFRLKGFLARKGVFRGNWDLKSRPFVERDEFQLMADLYESLPDFRQSAWYKRAKQMITTTGRFSHKDCLAHDLVELDQVFEGYLVHLLLTMKSEGYRQREGADYPEAMIGRDGTLIKTAHGTHRLCAAKIVGAPGLFPVKVVGVHREWLSMLLAGSNGNQSEVVSDALREVEQRYRAGAEIIPLRRFE